LAEQVARMGDTRNAYTASVGNPKRERPVPGPRRKWEDSKMGGSEIERLVRIGLIWLCMVRCSVHHSEISLKGRDVSSVPGTICLPRRSQLHRVRVS
jgi:hypothetical protein